MAVSLFSPRIQTKALVGLCRRLSTSLEAGIDARTVWAREVERAAGHLHLQRHLSTISAAANRGQSLADALAETGEFFPPIFRELAQVGEQTGHLDGVFAQLADHYQARLTMQRTFLAAIVWPMFQLAFALAVVGLWILISGMLDKDVLGLGLTGWSGLRIYLMFLAVAGAAIWLTLRAINRGLMWTRPIQRLMLRIPALGRPLQTMALERLAWSMHLTMNTDMGVRQALKLSLRSTQNARYIDQIPAIDAEIVAGNSIHAAFVLAGGYPADFLDTLAVGEESGKIVESMGLLARQYQERARMALAALAVIAGVVVWASVAALIVVLILRIFFTMYLNPIREYLPK
jgi:type II secretory pathway component PulF